MLSVRARRLVVLLAALTALLLTGCAAVSPTSGPTGAGGQNRVWAFTPAAQLLAPPTTSESSCSRPGFTVSAVGLASGFCVAAEGVTDITGEVMTESAARRAAFRSYNVPTSAANNFDRVAAYGKNPALRGPLGEPSEVITTTDVNGDPVSIANHSNGHLFTDVQPNTYEGPH